MGAKVIAIASRQRERAAAVAKEFDIATVCNDWQEVVAHRDVDLVSIVTPPSTHMEIALAALENRKAVLCEKPMAFDAEQSARMVEAARAAGVLALVDHELRFLNSRRTMRAMLQRGAIGQVRHCNYTFRSDYRGVLDRPWDWWSDLSMGGGTLGAIGSHVIDSFRWMLGTEIASVLGMLSTHIKQRPDKANGTTRELLLMTRPNCFFVLLTVRPTPKQPEPHCCRWWRLENTRIVLRSYGTTGALMVEETADMALTCRVWYVATRSG